MFASLLAALALSAAIPERPVGEQHRVTQQPSAAARDAEHRTRLRITVWYPARTGSAMTSIDVGPPKKPTFLLGAVAMDGAFADNARRPVIMVSHGFGGSARSMAWFGKAMAEHGYVVIAVDHPGNNGLDRMTLPGAVLWWERAEDLKLALAAVRADPRIGPHIDPARLGVAGFSLGGLTALVAGGARVSPENVAIFCREHPSDGICRPQLEYAVSTDQAANVFQNPAYRRQTANARADHSLPGIRAVFAIAPVVQALDATSLTAMRVPVSILVGEKDVTVPAETQARIAERLIPGARLEVMPGVTHYSFLPVCSAPARSEVRICRDADRQEEAHEHAIAAALALFDRVLR